MIRLDVKIKYSIQFLILNEIIFLQYKRFLLTYITLYLFHFQFFYYLLYMIFDNL